jgi:hypothetical protein
VELEQVGGQVPGAGRHGLAVVGDAPVPKIGPVRPVGPPGVLGPDARQFVGRRPALVVGLEMFVLFVDGLTHDNST